MRALVKYDRGPGLVEIREVPRPQPPPGWVQIQVRAVAICGSDIHIRDDAHPYWPPITLGHEFSGVISQLGEGVEGWEVGQRVVSETRTGSCGVCQLCQTGWPHVCPHKRPPGIGINGAMTDYLVMPARLLHRIPDNVSFDQAALMEPTACCIHGLLERVSVQPGDLVVIQGPGPIGIISLLLARIAGARAVIVSGTTRSARHRLPVAVRCGADVVVDVGKESLEEAVMDLSDGNGADVVFETSGSPQAIAEAFRIVRRCGRIGAIGISGGMEVPVPWDVGVFKAPVLTYCFSSTWSAWEHGLALLASGKLDLAPVITHRFTLDQWEQAFEVMENSEGLKVLIYPDIALEN